MVTLSQDALKALIADAVKSALASQPARSEVAREPFTKSHPCTVTLAADAKPCTFMGRTKSRAAIHGIDLKGHAYAPAE